MMTQREPLLNPVAVSDLRPTQITVGMREVGLKRQMIRAQSARKTGTFLGSHMVPVVLGPKKRNYVTDHHHLARALLEEGIEDVLVTVISDLSGLDKDAFFVVLDNRGWMHPFDENGKRRDYDAIPKTMAGLADDPYRSMAGELRRQGGFAKDTTPFSEFLWADFLRRRIEPGVAAKNFDKAMKEALSLAKGKDANYLPGWCGPTAD
ncbi:MAG: chromosome partitioning protein ParB [Mesorhizobium sp.]|nr:chromosome partitioning protein ParB [bacterium M00.F.Ca.ET.205.01.1.1]TGU53506.1 chromosome partitioning protein ParB [bacterium M00.F.Ca.ET.152.01.1.1]TGV37013.1 chromosome partitioning protein ParB [Mesorhizobium sp. M00.F.Ca.ET.186.01.1.1]TGZ41566.1 chromosome partitioning protein ParB [bacterium M00.F.Ca.ET.162.01.1.1]TIW62772.1 MAG: chromosome partitioning protein ParB [Mesorhizobium sp.]